MTVRACLGVWVGVLQSEILSLFEYIFLEYFSQNYSKYVWLRLMVEKLGNVTIFRLHKR